MKTSTVISLVALVALAGACQSDAKHSERQDLHGNYATTSKFNAMEREDFTAAMEDGLRDFDERLSVMEREAHALGPDAREEFYGDIEQLRGKRAEFAAELERHKSMLDEQWRGHREDVANMYVNLRGDLDDTFDEIVEEGQS